MNAKAGHDKVQSGLSEVKKQLNTITIFQIISLIAVFVMALFVVGNYIQSFVGRLIVLILVAVGGVGLLMLFIIIPTTKVEEFLRATVEKYNRLSRESATLKEHEERPDDFSPKSEPSEEGLGFTRYPEQISSEEGYGDIAAGAMEVETADDKNAAPMECSIIQPQDEVTINNTYRILIETRENSPNAKVEITFDNEEYIDITQNFDGTHYYYDWETTAVASDYHTVDARVVDDMKTPSIANAERITVMVDNVVKELHVEVKTDQKVYQVGATLRIEVKVTDGSSDIVPDATVEVTVYDSENSIQAAGQGVTNAHGIAYFGSEITEDDPVGIYQVEAHVSKQGFEDGMASITFEVEESIDERKELNQDIYA